MVATLLLDINSTPPAESDGVILPRGVAIDDEKIDAMAQDEEANGHTEATGTTRTYKIHEIFELPYCYS